MKKTLTLLFVTIVSFVFGQGGPPPRPCWEPPCNTVPIDSGIQFLVLAAVLYGIYNLYKTKNETPKDSNP